MARISKKWQIMAFCLGMGVFAAGINMAFMSRDTRAAVVVMDEKNIEQAIEQVIKTTEMLTTEQKNLAIQILQQRTFSPETLFDIYKVSGQTDENIDKAIKLYKGVMGKDYASVYDTLVKDDKYGGKFLWGCIGTVNDVFSGNITMYDGFFNIQGALKEQEKAYHDAQVTALYSKKILEGAQQLTKKGLEMNTNAGGLTEAIQSGNTILAGQNMYEFSKGTSEAALVQMLSTHFQAENVKEAERERARQINLNSIEQNYETVKEENNRKYGHYYKGQ